MMRSFKQGAKVALTTVAVGGFMLLSMGSEEIGSEAKPVISAYQCVTPDMRIINGEPDAGVSVTFVMTNKGKAGVVKITPKVSTSEGEWERQQTLSFNAGESKPLTYFFQEPSINASNIQCRVATNPQWTE